LIDLVVVTVLTGLPELELEELLVVGLGPGELLVGELLVGELLVGELVLDGVPFGEPEGSGDGLAAAEAEPVLPAPPHAYRIDARDKTSRR
jgi:hypothetical protein